MMRPAAIKKSPGAGSKVIEASSATRVGLPKERAG